MGRLQRRTCDNCGHSFTPIKSWQRFCAPSCYRESCQIVKRFLRDCDGCGQQFATNKAVQRFCEPSCRQRRERESYRSLNPPLGLPSGTVGAISELLVAVDLMRRGLHVFRCLSPHGPCDLAVLSNGTLKKVEVTTGSRSRSGKLFTPSKSPKHDFDVLAIVERNTSVIHYQPPLTD